MRLDARRVAGFLRDPGACRAVLLYGDDAGLIRARGAALTRAVAGSENDPFRVVDLDREGMARLAAEAAQLSLTGGRRVVRARDVTDGATDAVRDILAARGGRDAALVVLEAPSLAARSRLRTLLEAAADGAAIGCYPEEGRTLAETLRSTLAAVGVTADTDAQAWLAAHLGGDHAATRSEAEKLALYVGPGGVADLASARACIGDAAGLSLEDALDAACAGEAARADRALDAAFAEGASAVGVVRAALQHLQRLHQAALAMGAQRQSAADAVAGLRPPIFARRMPSVVKALGRFRPAALAAAVQRLDAAERECKRTGAPADAIARQAVIGLALAGAGSGGLASGGSASGGSASGGEAARG